MISDLLVVFAARWYNVLFILLLKLHMLLHVLAIHGSEEVVVIIGPAHRTLDLCGQYRLVTTGMVVSWLPTRTP